MMHAPLSVTTSQGMFSMCSTACHPSAVASLDPPPPPSLPPSRARTHTRTTHTHTHTNMAASVSPLRSSFRICSPLTLHHHCCRAKLRTHSRKCESQRRHLHQTATRHAAVVISGTELARQLHREIQRDVEELVAQGNMRPHLGVVLVGDDPASRTYVKNKTRAASILGISSDTVVRPSSVSQEELLELIDKMNRDWRVSGLLVQLPLPEHINERAVCNAIAPEKDVDGFHIVNIGKLCLDQRSMVPATPAAVWEIIKRAGIETVGKNVLVAGRSKNVGMPIAMLLHTDRNHERPGGDATVTIAHRCTPKEQLKELTSLADIIIAAAGVPGLITADMVKEGAAVIDVGINRIQDPKTGKLRLIGDVDFEGVKQKAGFITPVPGGVGPMTVAMLMKNTVTAARNALMH
uniref:Methylenetetrahydrofolate dehydrogenase (NADP+ dependent) 2 like n=2 Tax=Sparus aurata TaxID=8175 RepID=A0A671XRP4_SPAAU